MSNQVYCVPCEMMIKSPETHRKSKFHMNKKKIYSSQKQWKALGNHVNFLDGLKCLYCDKIMKHMTNHCKTDEHVQNRLQHIQAIIQDDWKKYNYGILDDLCIVKPATTCMGTIKCVPCNLAMKNYSIFINRHCKSWMHQENSCTFAKCWKKHKGNEEDFEFVSAPDRIIVCKICDEVCLLQNEEEIIFHLNQHSRDEKNNNLYHEFFENY